MAAVSIKDTDISTFQADVLEASMQKPVIVDFWADWCGPCKSLMPALEAAITERAGAIDLVKVNADQNQTLCAQLRIQSLPTVMAFWQGQPVDGFQGALPASQLNQFLDRVMQTTGADAGADDPLAQAMEQVKALLEAGDKGTAGQLLGQILQHDPLHIDARLTLAELEKEAGDMERVATLIEEIDAESLDDKDMADRLLRLQTAVSLQGEGDAGADTSALEARIAADPMDHDARFELALAQQARGDLEGAAEALLASIMRDRDWNEGAARAQLLKLFEAAGPTDPFTLKYRRRLSSVLFS